MSILDTLTAKLTSAAISSNVAMSKTTSTTYPEGGTSVAKITADAISAADKSLISVGINNSSIYRPILEMRDAAIRSDPTNSGSYTLMSEYNMYKIDTDIKLNLAKPTNTLFDIQKVSNEAVSSGVIRMGDSVNTVYPVIGSAIAKVGSAALPDSIAAVSKASVAAFGAASNSVANSMSSLQNTLATKASADALLKIKTAIPLPALPNISKVSTKLFTADHTPRGTTVVKEDLSSKAVDGANTTDAIYQEIKVYVEGVQVPFEACSITQAIGRLPSASIQLPPQAGLMDIIRYYQPKVHIFYLDVNTGGERLLFMGHIVACNYGHSQQSGSVSISFECVHKNELLKQLTFEWSAGGSTHATSGSDLVNTNPDQAVVQLNNFNSEASLILSLQGLKGVQSKPEDLLDPSNKRISEESINLLDKKFAEFENRLIGMPAAMMCIWNQVKKAVFAEPSLNIIFTKIYLPLVEDGIQFFNRTSGHYLVEKLIQDSKVDHCNDTARPELSKSVMLPPTYRMNIMSAIQVQMVISNLSSLLGFSGELMNFHDLFMNFYYGVDYDILTLASPAEVPSSPISDANLDNSETWNAQSRVAVETIVKPQLPFYYSPICNVILPNMYHSIQVSQLESEIPTRITCNVNVAAQAVNGSQALGLNYRAPQTIRESIALGRHKVDVTNKDHSLANLRETTGSSYNLPGKYEIGRGVIHRKIIMPPWLSYAASDKNEQGTDTKTETTLIEGSVEAKNVADLESAWNDRYGVDKGRLKLNPYGLEAGIQSYERLLFASADYEFTKDVVKAKTGGIDCIFNPYIIPGYPMDILSPNPNHPSFHAMCASVTHSITSRSIGTSVSFISAITYTEMYNYFLPPIHPWLQTALQIVNVNKNSSTETESINQSLIDNKIAKLTADKFYKSVLGVGSAEPSQMYDFNNGVVLMVARDKGIWVDPGQMGHSHTSNGGEGNDNLTGVGNLRLVARQVESKKGVEDRFKIKFIDMTPDNYSGTPAKYLNNSMSSNTLLEPGASLFLDYEEISDFISDVIPTEEN